MLFELLTEQPSQPAVGNFSAGLDDLWSSLPIPNSVIL